MDMNANQTIEFLKDATKISRLLPDNLSIDKPLGIGGQGIVYKGSVSGSDAAIKIYFPGQVQLRIERETDVLLKLNNPHIVKLLWKGHLNIGDMELPAVATEYIDGTSLDEVIKGGKLNHQEIGMIACDIADAIDAMWTPPTRIVHRDLKPANILIKTNGRACVIDLGIARHIDRTPLTTAGATWGTEGYMSPEQANAAKQITCKSDIFALGVILVECAMGRHPSWRDQMRLLTMDLFNNLPHEINGWEYVRIVKAMLNPRPEKRPSPQEITDYLSIYQ